MCFLTSLSLCYPPTHIHLHSFLFSFSSTKDLSSHTVHKACQHIKVFVYVFNTQGMFVKLKNRLMTLQTYLSYILLYFCVLWPLSADNCQNVTLSNFKVLFLLIKLFKIIVTFCGLPATSLCCSWDFTRLSLWSKKRVSTLKSPAKFPF